MTMFWVVLQSGHFCPWQTSVSHLFKTSMTHIFEIIVPTVNVKECKESSKSAHSEPVSEHNHSKH